MRDCIDGRDPPTILDVRGGDEYCGELGHIPGLIHIPPAELPDALSQRAALFDRALIVVCKTDRRSVKAAEVLVKAGFQRIEIMQGGMESWTIFDFPVVRSGSAIKQPTE